MEVITTHTETDFDGLASMVAAQNLYPGSVLVIPRSCQPSVRSFLSTHSLPHTPEGALQFNEISRLVLVDTQDPARIGSLKKLLENQKVSVHIFDHHPTDSPKIQADFCLVNPVGATITLLVEYLQERGTKITPFHATLYSIGLYEETGSLLYPDTTHRDMQVAAFLLQHGADLNVVANYIRREMTVPQIELLNAMIQASHALYLGRCRVLLIILSWPTYIPNLAGLVEQLSKLERVDAVLAAVAMEGKVTHHWNHYACT